MKLRKGFDQTLSSGHTNSQLWFELAPIRFRTPISRQSRCVQHSETRSNHTYIEQDIYGHNTKCVKDVFYDALAGSHHHLADATDKLDHQRKRRIMASAYALKNLEGWEHKVADKTARFIHAADVKCTGPPKKSTTLASEDFLFDYRAYANFLPSMLSLILVSLNDSDF